MRSQWDARVDAARRHIVKAGVTIIEDLDHDAFARSMAPVWGQFVRSPEMETIIDRIARTSQPLAEESLNDE